jgi:uncharacterized membrane protein
VRIEDVPLPGKTEMKKDRAHLESAIEALETAKASMKLFRELTSVRDLPQLHKQAKALRRPLKEIRMQADDLLASWVAGVEEQKAGSRKR